MANEATIIIETQRPIPFTVADGTGIEKGATLTMTDPMTAVQNADGVSGSVVAGINATEKIASDGRTKSGVYRQGIFKVTLSGSATVGDPAYLDGGANMFRTLSNDNISGSVVAGTFLETGTTGETVLMELNIQQAGGSI